MSELDFSLWVPTILSTPLACTNIDTAAKTAKGEGEPSDKVCEIAAAPVSERFTPPPRAQKWDGRKSDRQTKKQYVNTAGLDLMHSIWHFKVQ